jgi:hypothetical protein
MLKTLIGAATRQSFKFHPTQEDRVNNGRIVVVPFSYFGASILMALMRNALIRRNKENISLGGSSGCKH